MPRQEQMRDHPLAVAVTPSPGWDNTSTDDVLTHDDARVWKEKKSRDVFSFFPPDVRAPRDPTLSPDGTNVVVTQHHVRCIFYCGVTIILIKFTHHLAVDLFELRECKEG